MYAVRNEAAVAAVGMPQTDCGGGRNERRRIESVVACPARTGSRVASPLIALHCSPSALHYLITVLLKHPPHAFAGQAHDAAKPKSTSGLNVRSRARVIFALMALWRDPPHDRFVVERPRVHW